MDLEVTIPAQSAAQIIWMTADDSMVQAMREIKQSVQTFASKRKNQAVIMTAQVVLSGLEWARVKKGDKVYYRARGGVLFKQIDKIALSNLVRDVFRTAWGVIPVSDWLASTVRTVCDNIINVMDEIDKRYIQVSESVLWDTETNNFMDLSAQTGPAPNVFRRFFDTPFPQKNVAVIPPLSYDEALMVQSRYNDTLREINSGIFNTKIEPIRVWADGKYDVYTDIMRCLASILTKKKPLGCYMLIGTSRSGKSTFVGMVKTLLGTNNCSGVRLSQLGDDHYTHDLLGTMFNAPDEEDDKFLKSEAQFKTLADHGEIRLSVMRSNVGIDLHADFMCAFPMNHFPKFVGDGAGACTKRSLAIPFFANLSAYDKATEDFATATYTKEFMINLLGDVLAYTTYYTSHPFVFSPTMDSFRGNIENGSVGEYFDLWKKHFNGFQTFSLLYKDYQMWCRVHDVEFKGRDNLKMYVARFEKSSYTDPKTKKKYRVYKDPENRAIGRIMYEYCVNPSTKETVKEMHSQFNQYDGEGARSIVDELEEFYDGKLG